MNISGILVVAKLERQADVVEALAGLAGIEVHQVDEASGRIIVIQEAEDIHAEIDGVKRIKALPHVVMADMVYHYIADDDKNYEEIPPELVEQEQACSVPAYLNE
ncbi:MAG: chaperone NapD [Gallionellaceae bacterium]|nr:chaperone NapD [Gallionellaceae bacterium]